MPHRNSFLTWVSRWFEISMTRLTKRALSLKILAIEKRQVLYRGHPILALVACAVNVVTYASTLCQQLFAGSATAATWPKSKMSFCCEIFPRNPWRWQNMGILVMTMMIISRVGGPIPTTTIRESKNVLKFDTCKAATSYLSYLDLKSLCDTT